MKKSNYTLTFGVSIEIMLGATATLTFRHWFNGVLDTIWSIASFNTSIPVAEVTCIEPRYCAFNTFFGSSIGVGNDCAVTIKQLSLSLSFLIWFKSINQSGWEYSLTKACPFLWKRRCSVGKLVGLVARLVRPLISTGFAKFWCWDRSIIIFLHMSRSVLAIVRAGMSQRNTWHMCFRVDLSLAT